MDRLEEWMNRALDPKKTEGTVSGSQNQANQQNQQKPQEKKKEGFWKKFKSRNEPKVAQGENRSPQNNRPPQNKPSPRPNRPGPQQNRQNPQNSRPHPQKGKPVQIKREVPKLVRASKQKPVQIKKGQLKMIPLGGLNEVGKNMMAIEFEDDIIIVDMGLEFPSEEMFGIDYVIPDVSYLEDNKKRIRGVVLTHAHLDHIGGIPYILPRLDFPPLYGTKLTMGLVQKRIEEFRQERMVRLNVINPDEPLRLGKFLCTFIRVAHSIPDAVAVVIDTPAGKIMHTGDFKFDETPARNQLPADIHKLEKLKNDNILALFCESTNALKPGHSMSEQEVGNIIEDIVKKTPARLIVATFSSQIGRLQQIMDAAEKGNRKVFISGRSMIENIKISAQLGYIALPKDGVHDLRKYKKNPEDQTLIITTGSQGESVSALARMASGEHPNLQIRKGDTIVISSSPIIGNEKAIYTIVNQLSILGANVIHNQILEVHTSGHGKQEELKRMIDYVKPKYLIPIHGEYYMRQGLANLAKQRCGFSEDNVILLQNGDVLVAENNQLKKSAETVETKYILIDGRGEGQMDSQVQVDREIMSRNGALVVLIYVSAKTRNINRDTEVISRGFIYMHESGEITQEVAHIATEAYRTITKKNPGANRKDIKRYIQQTVDRYTDNKLERRPLIVPLIVEV